MLIKNLVMAKLIQSVKENTEFVWVELPKGASYYLDQEGTYAENGKYVLGNVNGDAHTGEFIRDLLKAADDQVDFSQYAEDGEVPNIFIVHEGTGAEMSNVCKKPRSHKWKLICEVPYTMQNTMKLVNQQMFMRD